MKQFVAALVFVSVLLFNTCQAFPSKETEVEVAKDVDVIPVEKPVPVAVPVKKPVPVIVPVKVPVDASAPAKAPGAASGGQSIPIPMVLPVVRQMQLPFPIPLSPGGLASGAAVEPEGVAGAGSIMAFPGAILGSQPYDFGDFMG